MSADGIINIDILLGKKQEFLNDIQHIDQLLAKLGTLTGEKMDASFSDQAKGLKVEAKETKEKVDETFSKPTKFKLKAENNEANKEITATKEFLQGIPKEKLTQLKAQNAGLTEIKATRKEVSEIPEQKITKLKLKNSDANKEITTTKDFLKGIPKEKITKFKADNDQAVIKIKNTKKQVEDTPKEKTITFKTIMDGFKKSMSGMNKTLDETERHSSRLKDIIMGTVAGNLVTGGIDKITESLKEAFNESVEYDKEQQVMMARWTTLTGDSDKSKDMVKTINDLSVATGQASDVVDELEQGFYHLHSNKGESDNLTKSMLNMADAVGLSKDQINAVTQDMVHGLSTGRLSIGELNQISNYFPMFGEALLDYKKKVSGNSQMTMADLRKLASQGKISADEVEKVFNELGQDKYGEAAENMLKTMTGMERTIKARVPALLGEFMKPILTAKNPFYESVSKWVSDKKTENEFKKMGNATEKGIGAITKAFYSVSDSKGGLNVADRLIQSLTKHIQEGSDWIAKHSKNISGIVQSTKTIVGIIADTAWHTFSSILGDISDLIGITSDKGNKSKDVFQTIDGLLKGLAKNKGSIQTFTKLVIAMTALKKVTSTLSGPISVLNNGFGKLATRFTESEGGLKGLLGLIKPGPFMIVGAVIAALGVAFYEAYKHSKTFRNGVNDILQAAEKFGSHLYKKYIGPAISSVSSSFSKWGKQISRWWEQNGAPLEKAIKNFAVFLGVVFAVPLGEMKGIWIAVWHGIEREAKIVWTSIKGIISGGIKIIEGIVEVFEGIFTGKWSKIWKGVKDIFSGGVQALGSILTAGIKTLGNIGVTIGEAIGNAIVGGINGVIDGIDWISEKLTGHKTKIHHVKALTISKYEQGTGHHPGGLALINDANDPVHEELVIPKTGSPYIPKGKNIIANLEEGTQVVPAPLTKMMLDFGMIPKYETGTGFWSGVWDKAKDIAGDVMDYASHPEKLVNLAINKFVTVKSDASEVVDVGWGAIKYLAKEAIEKVKSWFEEMGTGSGSRGQFLKIAEAQGDKPYVWGAEGPNAFDCSGLVKWALGQVGISFPHYSGDQFSMTQPISESEAKPGDLAFYGPGGDEHVGIVTGKNKMFAAQSPSSHPNIGPDSIHNGLPFSGIHRIRQLTDGGGANNPAGAGVNRWIPMINQAAKTMHVSLSDTMLHTILGLIQGESGGNASVNQQITDVNSTNGSGGAKGLIQFIQSTFDAYKMPEHGNIYSGYDQLLALFNDSNWQTDIHPYGGWGPSGQRRFANGGWANQASIFGEVPGQPEVAINPKRDSADRFINEAIEARAKEAPNSLSAKIAGILHSAKQGVQSVLPECQVSGHAVKNILHSGETEANGDLVVIVELDNGEIFKAQYPLHKAMEAHELVIEQSKAGIV